MNIEMQLFSASRKKPL